MANHLTSNTNNELDGQPLSWDLPGDSDNSACNYPSCSIDGIRYEIARNRRDFEDIFRQRYEVLVRTDQYYKSNAIGMIYDKFDFLEETSLIMAKYEGTLIGSVRLVVGYNAEGIPSDDYFNFLDHLKTSPNKIGDLSRISVVKAFRERRIAFNLMRFGQYFGIQKGVGYFVGVANPKAMNLFKKLGWRAVSPQSYSEKFGVPYIPIVGQANSMQTLSFDERGQ